MLHFIGLVHAVTVAMILVTMPTPPAFHSSPPHPSVLAFLLLLLWLSLSLGGGRDHYSSHLKVNIQSVLVLWPVMDLH